MLAPASTVVDLLRIGVETWPDQPWCRTPGGETSRRDAIDNGRRVAAGLVAHGVEPGDHVVLVLPNTLDFVHAWFGAILAGAVVVAVNPIAAATEVAEVEHNTNPRLLVATSGQELAVTAPVLDITDLGTENEPLDWDSVHRPVADDAITYIQTSGSTGRPKFVIETHRMYTMAAEGLPFWLGLDENDVLLTSLPLSHLNAQAYSLLGSFGCGAELVLLPRFSASTFWDDVDRYGVTQFNAIGAMVEALMSRPVSVTESRNHVRICYSAPAPRAARHQEIEERFGFRLVIGYALSESPYGLIVPVDSPTVPEAMGVPRQHPVLGIVNEARVVDAQGADVPVGATGELEFRNPAITPGYYNNPEESRQIRRDGWLRTGDLATRDEQGYYYFAGRLKEIIRHRGENLSPTEVENVVMAHPAVATCAVIGVPSLMSEEDVKAFVVLQEGSVTDAAGIEGWCADRLPPYKRPRYVEFVNALPLTETQKIAKQQLSTERNDTEIDLADR